jgi:Arc/MetJ family transcription regulator
MRVYYLLDDKTYYDLLLRNKVSYKKIEFSECNKDYPETRTWNA